MKVFKPSDFKTLFEEIEGFEEYKGSVPPNSRELLATTANRALSRLVGIEKRISRKDWISLYDKLQTWGDAMNREIEVDDDD